MRVTTLKAPAAGLGGTARLLRRPRRGPGRAGPAKGPVDYYLDPDEPAGRWWGDGRAALGLAGEVDGEDLRALLEGRHPRTGRALGRRFGDRSARAFDATFSAPKSVSALWALSPDRFVRAEVLAAHDAAVDAALGWFETHGAVTRRGTDGVHQVDTQGLTAALFRQHTSRTGGSAAAHPRRDLCQGAGPDREVAVARRPVPEAPAAHHRLDLRRRPASRAHPPPRRRLGTARVRRRST